MTEEIKCIVPLKNEEGEVVGKAEVTKSGMIYGTITNDIAFERHNPNPGDPFISTTFSMADEDFPNFEAWKRANRQGAIVEPPVTVSRIHVSDEVREILMGGKIDMSYLHPNRLEAGLSRTIEEVQAEMEVRRSLDGLDKDSGHAGFEAWKRANRSSVVPPKELTEIEINNNITRSRLLDSAFDHEFMLRGLGLDDTSFSHLPQGVLEAIEHARKNTTNVELENLYQVNQDYIRDLMNPKKEENNGA